MPLKIFVNVLENLQECGVLLYPTSKLEAFDFSVLYKASDDATRLLLGQKLLKLLKKSLDR